MKALLCNRPRELSLVDRPTPAMSNGQALVRIRRVGLCGTDYHIFNGRHPFVNYPLVIGHELSGEVAETGSGSRFRRGQLVAINPYLNCGHCIACRRGKPNACVNIKVLGVHTDGGMCELLAVPETALIDASGLTLEQAAMLEFLSIGAHAVARSRLRPDHRILVTGAGPIGIAAALFARLEGAAVTLVDVRATRLDYARDKLGFVDVAVADQGLDAALAERTQGEMFDVVFDATGNLQAMSQSLLHVAHGGSLVLVGVAPGDLTFADPEFHKREATLVASRNALDSDFQRVADAIRASRIPTEALQTHRLALDEVAAGMPLLISDADHVLKAIATL